MNKIKLHSEKPSHVRKNQTWSCKCRAINVGTDSYCKMILIEKSQGESRLEFAKIKLAAKERVM